MGPRSDFSKPRQGAAEKSANATRRCCLARGSQPVGISTEETFVFAASFCTMRRFLCLKNFGRLCRAPNPEVGCEPGGVIHVLFENPSISRFFLCGLQSSAGNRIAFNGGAFMLHLFSQAQTALLLPDSSPGVLPGGVEVLLGGHAVLLFKGAEKVVVTAKAAGLVHLGDGQPLLDEGAAAV